MLKMPHGKYVDLSTGLKTDSDNGKPYSDYIWQAMRLSHFFSLFQNKQLTLQRFYGKGAAESNDSEIIAKNILDIYTSLRSTTDYKKIKKHIKNRLTMLDSSFYFCCFYCADEPSANMLSLFGGENGVILKFEKEKIIARLKKHAETLVSNEFVYSGQVKYINNYTEINSVLDELKKVIIKENDISDKVNADNNALKEAYAKLRFIKSKFYENESEFRVLCDNFALHHDNHEENVLSYITKSKNICNIPIRLSDIKSIAVHKNFFMKETVEKLIKPYYAVTPKENYDYNHPLEIYNFENLRKKT